MDNRVVESFLSMGIQSWGQSPQDRQQATDAYLKAAGFDLSRDQAAADEWLKGVLRNLKRGRFETEVEQLRAAIDTRKAA